MLPEYLLNDHDDMETGDGHQLDWLSHHRYKVVHQLGNGNAVVADSTDLTSSTFQNHGASLL